VWRQYDHQLFLNTVVGPGGDAAVLRLRDPEHRRDTGRGLAVSTDGKGRFCRLDPRTGGRLAVIEAARNVACTGAIPKALVNCLNFGNPEHPEVMWQFAEVVDGMSEACEALGIPVIGGNVSFYNESRGADIDPTPVVAVLGIVERLEAPPPGIRVAAGERLVVLGATAAELGGSEWAAVVQGLTGGRPPDADLESARRLHDLVAGLVADGVVEGVHDCSDGGLAVTLAEMAIEGGCGMVVDLTTIPGAADLAPAVALFSESASRVVVAVEPGRVADVLGRAGDAGVPAAEIGAAGGDRFTVEDGLDLPLDAVAAAWRDAIPALMDAVSPSPA
jgi:phosphoribosylformylglycinamidine synthase